MKKILSYAISALCAVLLAAACSTDATEAPFAPADGMGAANIRFNVPGETKTGEEAYPWNHCAIRVYKYTAGEDGSEQKELIRRYGSREEMPEALWLVEGRYNIDVELGSKAEATFTEKSYKGSQDFTVAGGVQTPVDVECRIINTIVEVRFDETIPATFVDNYDVTAAIADSFDAAAVADGSVLSLNYTESKAGYFMLPADASSLSWCFYGLGRKNGEEIEVEKFGTKAISAEPGMRYLLTYRYSKDLGGYLTVDFEIAVDESTDDRNDDLMFVPNPQIAGDGFEIDQTQTFVNGTIGYEITSISNLDHVTVTYGGETFTLSATQNGSDEENGLAVAVKSETEIVLTLGEAFFTRMTGGENTFTITAYDVDGVEGERESTVRTQGVTAFAATDRWNARGEATACIFDPAASNVAIRYRKAGTEEWSTAAATAAGSESYTAVCEGIAAESEYEYQLVIDGKTTGAARTATTDGGAQIYNAGFETWSGTSPLLPYISDADQIWDSGNHGSATLNKNVTTNEPDARPGSTGRISAKLQSQFVSLFGIGKFAAGNIFVGKYLGTDGTNGIIGFGKAFQFDYRPKALTFWYKGNIGTIDKVSDNAPAGIGSGSSDVSQVYICLCKMDGPHVVKTKDASTFLTLPAKTMSYTTADLSGMTDDKAKSLVNDRTDGKVIACGLWEPDNSVQHPEWTKITVELDYNEEYEGEVPTYLMLTASASKYGDYFTGSTSSVMYLDDVELVY